MRGTHAFLLGAHLEPRRFQDVEREQVERSLPEVSRGTGRSHEVGDEGEEGELIFPFAKWSRV